MPTIKDIARECGVSANTVSSVLNNKPGEVSARTRERILEAMHRMGYRPSAAARRMVGKRMNTIGIADRYTASSLENPYKAQMLEPLVHAARASQWDVLYYSGHISDHGYYGFLDGRSDGLLCFTGGIAQEEEEAILQTGLPVVFIGETPSGQSGNRGALIDVDNEIGAYLAVSHLTELGHTRIAMMQGIGISGNATRIAGYHRALAQGGLTRDDSLLYPTIAWEGSGYAEGLTLLAQKPTERPTAVFCFNDVLAFGLLKAAAESGVRVPEDLSVIGFDDVSPAATTSPPLTTIRQPLALIGQRAVEMLIGIIEGRLPRDVREIVLPELVLRTSTAPPHGRS
jgi:LacI family transcriptional regulator